MRSEEHTSELQSPCNLVCRLLLEKKKKKHKIHNFSSTGHQHISQHKTVSSAADPLCRLDANASPAHLCPLGLLFFFFFFLMIRRPPKSTLFPSPTLFR